VGLKEDYRTIKLLLTSSSFRKKALSRLGSIGRFTKENFKIIIKEYWIWYLIILFAFCCGFMLASAYYGGKCQVIINQVIENLTGIIPR